MDGLLSRKDAAARLGVSLMTLDAERAAGRLAYIQKKPNGKVWITEQAIEEYLARGTHHVKPERKIQQTYRNRRADKVTI